MIDKFSNILDLKKTAAQKKLRYFNRMQRESMVIAAHDTYIIAARGTGKSEGLDAPFILRNVWDMPGSTGGFISPSYIKAWSNTLPAICKALAELGYFEDVHYYVGKRAPANAGFAKPKRPPLRDAWTNCLHFWNGTILVILSLSNAMSANSMSLDWLIGPEAKFLNYEKIKSEINPANRGNINHFGYSPRHHSVLYTTDMPTTKIGRWMLEKENEMDVEHINLIRSLYAEKKELLREPETAYRNRKIKALDESLAMCRQYQLPKIPTRGKEREYTVFFGEYDVFDNLEVLGEDFIWQMKRESPPLIFRTAFMNERIFRVVNCFYSALDEDVHFYIPEDNDSLVGKIQKQSPSCAYDTDMDTFAPLSIAFDANSAISTCCICQPDKAKNEMRTINSMFVKNPQKIQDLVLKVCKYYASKQKKEIIFYYDHTFVWTTAASSESYADIIIRYFEQNGWSVTPAYIGQQPSHYWRNEQIDLALKGDSNLLFPTFNLYNNEYLKMAMEQCGVKTGKNGFEKDKSPESTPDTLDNPDEHKPHITDAWDTLFVGVNFYYKEPTSGVSTILFL